METKSFFETYALVLGSHSETLKLPAFHVSPAFPHLLLLKILVLLAEGQLPGGLLGQPLFRESLREFSCWGCHHPVLQPAHRDPPHSSALLLKPRRTKTGALMTTNKNTPFDANLYSLVLTSSFVYRRSNASL